MRNVDQKAETISDYKLLGASITHINSTPIHNLNEHIYLWFNYMPPFQQYLQLIIFYDVPITI